MKIEPASTAQRGCRLVWSRLVASGVIDPGSNPGSPINKIVRSSETSVMCKQGFLFLLIVLIWGTALGRHQRQPDFGLP